MHAIDTNSFPVLNSSSLPRSKTPFQEVRTQLCSISARKKLTHCLSLQAYVFVVGGGNYIEYQNLLEYCRRGQSAKKVTYGTSELMNARQFLHQVRAVSSGASVVHSFPHTAVRARSECGVISIRQTVQLINSDLFYKVYSSFILNYWENCFKCYFLVNIC